MSNLIQRIFSALAFAAITFAAFYYGYPYLNLFVMSLCLLILGEWTWLCFRKSHSKLTFLSYYFFGTVYIVLASVGFWKVIDTRAGQMLFLGLLILVWSSDIGAYAVGRLIGGPKLAPRISPGKTISGALGGLICALIIPHSVSKIVPIHLWGFWSLVGVAILAQLGDLLESWVKRRLDVKDSSGLLPGHGGLLDRLDSILPIGVLLAFLY